MPKYYIKSGDIRYIVDTTDPESAILSALYHYKNKNVIPAHRICVSETGFDDFKNWKCYDTEDYVKKI